MESWRRFLRHLAPRSDAPQPFYPQRVEPSAPALLNTMDMLSAAYVGGRLVQAIALRGGTRQKPSAAEGLLRRLSRALPEEVIHHCEAEAERILEWLHEAETLPEPPSPQHPELDLMLASDVQSRLQLAQQALEQGLDLELERYDADLHRWFRHRATPLKLIDAEVGDLQSALQLRDQRGHVLSVAIKSIRWLMPVTPATPVNTPTQTHAPKAEPVGGELLSFPFGRSKDRPTLLDEPESEAAHSEESPLEDPFPGQ